MFAPPIAVIPSAAVLQAERGISRAPRALVWGGHSCPLPADVEKIRIRVCLQAYRKPRPTVEERRFSAASDVPKREQRSETARTG
jgi:hypothetical protein